MTAKTRCQRRAPFLHRNWIKGVKAWQGPSAMGNIVSSPAHKGSLQADDDGTPPLKRRRISSPNSLDVDHLTASPRTSDSRSALRIEVLKVFHKDSKKVRSYQTNSIPRDVLNTKASCRVTISDLSSGRPRVLHCQSRICDLTIFKNPLGPHRIARVSLPRPFFVPEESILVNRQDDGKFDLADSYELLVELEAAHDAHWPPLDFNDFGIPAATSNPSTSGRTWVLSSRFGKIFGRLKSPLSLSAGCPSHQLACQSDYVMDIDLRWSAGFKALRRLEKGSMPCINAIDPDTDPFVADDLFAPALDGATNGINDINGINRISGVDGINRMNGNNGNHMDESSLEPDDQVVEEAQTPSRALRTRKKNKVYNLKVLSDQAQGRERKRRARGTHVATSQGRVSYLLPSDQPVCLDFYRCVTCGAYHQTILQLQVHLQTLHLAYDYVLETTSQGPQFRVTGRCEAVGSPSKQYQLKPPVKPFSLESFAAGDQSWITSRLGPDTVDGDFALSKQKSVYDRLPSRSPAATHPRPAQRRAGRLKGSKVVVPNIKQPLFDPISKARLMPGEEVPKMICDSTWLIHKHRESIGDFTDVTPAEKEYIWEWDGYILRQNITSAAYLPRAWLDFVREKASWLVAVDQRMLEFGKHASVLLVRDLLNDKTIREALSHINEARSNLQSKADEATGATKTDIPTKMSPRAAQIRKGANGCTICQLPVLGPRLLVCSNKLCSRRLYHSDCIEKEVITPTNRREWRCNACSRLERPA